MKHVLALTLVAMIAFAGNSIIVRMALASGSIGPLSFGVIRLLAGAIVLALLVKPERAFSSGSWTGALCLLTYVVFFSYAYLSLDAGTGALILFAIVQIVMIGSGIRHGERLTTPQWVGTGTACLGLVFLLRPGTAVSPDPLGALIMAMAGLGWALYSLLGRHVEAPTLATAGNFVKAFALVLLISVPLLWIRPEDFPSTKGVVLATVSGGVTSGLGYALWYCVLRYLPATRAGVAQLSVPAIAAIGGLIFLDEAVTVRLLITSAMVLGGVAIATIQADSVNE
jgi:drug/metabolite transporter (DMT)-like permease